MKRSSTPMIIALLSVIIILLVCLTLPAFGQSSRLPNRSEMPRTLSVSGQGFVDIPQTLAQVQIGVETQKDTAVMAQTDIAQRSTAVVQLLKKKSEIKKLSTAGVSLNPVYDNQNGQQEVTGYRGSKIVRFQIEPAAIGGLLDEAVNAGASRIDGVTLVAADEAIATAEDGAITQATEQARRQAKAALGVLNLEQQEIINVQINGAGPSESSSPALQNFLMDVAKTSSLPVVAGEQRISATVTLQVRY